MYKPLTWWVGALFMAGAATSLAAATLHIEIDQDALQAHLEELFPVIREEPLFRVSMLQPEVLLNPASERIGVRVVVTTHFPDDLKITGAAVVDGKLRYESGTRSLFLNAPRVRVLEIDGVSQVVVREILDISNLMLTDLLGKVPIYRFTAQQQPENMRLQNISVREGKLVVDLAMQ